MPNKTKTEKVQKHRLEEADVTEISLVPSGAVEDADYVVLLKEAPEEPADVEDTPDDILAKAIDAIVLGREQLSEDQVTLLLKSVLPAEDVTKADEESDSDEVEDSDEESEDKPEEDEVEKECGDLKKSDSERLAALEAGLQELLAKLSPTPDATVEETPETVVEKEDTPELDPIAKTAQILQERSLAKQRDASASQHARVTAAIEKMAGDIKSVADGVAETKRQLARACGQDA